VKCTMSPNACSLSLLSRQRCDKCLSFSCEGCFGYRVGGVRPVPAPTVQVKRVYEPPSDDDGVRVLVDRPWPRGLSKGRASVDLWLKDLAPSTALCRWFNHDPSRWDEFIRRYATELDAKQAGVAALNGAVRRGRVTLLFGARDERHNNAVALGQYLTSQALTTERGVTAPSGTAGTESGSRATTDR